MEEKKNKKGFAATMGRFIANAIVVCVSTCVLALLASITYTVVGFILRIGGII